MKILVISYSHLEVGGFFYSKPYWRKTWQMTLEVSGVPSRWMQGWSLMDVLVEAIRICWDMWCYNATMSACEKGQQWQHALGTAAGCVWHHVLWKRKNQHKAQIKNITSGEVHDCQAFCFKWRRYSSYLMSSLSMRQSQLATRAMNGSLHQFYWSLVVTGLAAGTTRIHQENLCQQKEQILKPSKLQKNKPELYNASNTEWHWLLPISKLSGLWWQPHRFCLTF